MRQVLTLGIVASWVVMAALLVQRHTRPTAEPFLVPPAASLDERDEWFGVYAEDRKIGHAHRVTARTDVGYTFYEDSVVAQIDTYREAGVTEFVASEFGADEAERTRTREVLTSLV